MALTSLPAVSLASTTTPAVSGNWVYWQELAAYSGGGCAAWNGVPVLSGETLASSGCGGSDHAAGETQLEYRYVDSNHVQIGITAEGASYDLTPSNGWRWEPANDNEILAITTYSNGYSYLAYGSHFIGPNGDRLPLQDVSSPTMSNAGWKFITCSGIGCTGSG